MTAELLISVSIGVLALGLGIHTAYRQRDWPGTRGAVLETREAILDKQVADLKATVSSLLATDRDRQKRIESLEQDLAGTRLSLARAESEIKNLRDRLQRYETDTSKLVNDGPPLLVVSGPDPDLQVDLAALRGAGLRITRLQVATYANFKSTLERARRQGKPLEYVHLAVHANPQGIVLDRLVNRIELSELLRGVRVLVVLGCLSDTLVDLLTVVPYVVGFRETVPHDEAWQFALLFWSSIGNGLPPQTAFDIALERGPTGIGEYAELIQN